MGVRHSHLAMNLLVLRCKFYAIVAIVRYCTRDSSPTENCEGFCLVLCNQLLRARPCATNSCCESVLCLSSCSSKTLLSLAHGMFMPILHGRHLVSRPPGREGDMLRVCSNSAVVHTPAIANLHRQDWCKLCGCNPFKEVCTLCYHGVRTQSSYGQGPETSAKMPVGALQRLHNLGNCFLGSIHNPRRPAGSDVPSEVNLVKLL